MRGIKYVGPIFDFSGYGEAARNYILSLHKLGVPITVKPRNFDLNPPKIADDTQRIVLESLVDKQISYDIVIIHLTPDLWPLYVEQGKYNIGFVAWETSLLHPKWVAAMSAVEEVFVPCEWNKESFINSGVRKPITVIPHGIDVGCFENLREKEFSVNGLDKSTYKFYSIFQWSARKNPEGMLRAYLNAFSSEDNVAFVMKTYLGGKHPDERAKIVEMVKTIKKDMGLRDYPKIVLIADLLSKEQMLGLHLMGDCYFSLHRGEGWGLPCFEAGLCGNPVIATGYSGNMTFMGENNSYPVGYMETFVSSMSNFNQWYKGDQLWAEPSQVHASDLLRYVFENREEAGEKGKLLSKEIKEKYSWDKVSELIISRLSNL